MYSQYQQELIEILRRTAVRGKWLAEDKWMESDYGDSTFVDIFNHLLDEIGRLKHAD